MAAANVTLAGSQGQQFAASTAVFVATLRKPGGKVIAGAVALWIAEGQTTCVIDGTDNNAVKIAVNAPLDLNPTTTSFAFRTDSSTDTPAYKPS